MNASTFKTSAPQAKANLLDWARQRESGKATIHLSTRGVLVAGFVAIALGAVFGRLLAPRSARTTVRTSASLAQRFINLSLLVRLAQWAIPTWILPALKALRSPRRTP